MSDVDLSVLSPAMLDSVWARLLVEFATAKDACDKDAEHAAHLALAEVIDEYAKRTDAWIAQHAAG